MIINEFYIFLAVTLGAVFITFLAVDIYYWWIERYPRFGIGKWSSDASWQQAAEKVALSWLPKIPSIPVTANRNLVLLDIIRGKYTSRIVQNWQVSGLIMGVSAMNSDIAKDKIKKTRDSFINDQGGWKKPPSHSTSAALAYSLLKSTENKTFLKPAMDEVISLLKSRIGNDGTVLYSVNRKNLRYVDSLGLICPFLAYYSRVYGDKQYVELALKQIEHYTLFGMYPETCLPAHAYEENSKLPLGVFGWGRGTGWYVLALADVCLELEESASKERLKILMKKTADYLLNYQRKDGGFGVFIHNPDYSYDSSATVFITYFYNICYRIFKDEHYINAAKRGMTRLRKMTRRSGALDYCQGDTIDIGTFSRRSEIMPFAQGLLVRNFHLMKK